MTEPSSNAGAKTPHFPEETPLPFGKIAVVSIVTLVTFAVFVVFTDRIRQRHNAETAGAVAPTPPQVGKPEIGVVDQALFETERRAADERKARLERLSTYGWVDRERGLIHIPIERAMEQVRAEQQR